jgi:hypothetical protein
MDELDEYLTRMFQEELEAIDASDPPTDVQCEEAKRRVTEKIKEEIARRVRRKAN